MQVYKILLPVNVDEPFDYSSEQKLLPGQLVKVPFRSGIKIGVVWGEGTAEIESSKIKSVIEPMNLPPFDAKMIKFIEWVAEYYMSSLGNVLKLCLPVKFTNKAKAKTDKTTAINYTAPSLSEIQQNAVNNLTAKLKRKFSTTLLDGVTGSGKTEVYFDLIHKTLENGKQVLVLLPEIALSVQWLERFKSRFGAEPGIWHSDRTDKERRETWVDVLNGNQKIIVGARSALFLPFKDLGLIIVDEEHDQSYKQDEGVIYHGRDMAVIRASIQHIPILLVSATPSVETVNNVQEGKYELIHLPERFGGAGMPHIEIVDMRQEKLPADKFISIKLKDEIAEKVANNQQVLLFLNRRGYAPLTLCRACGHRFQCPNCSAWLVHHKPKNNLECHHCGYHTKMPKACPACKVEDKLAPCGPGVERLYDEVREIFPNARVEIMASDSPKSAQEIVQKMLSHEIDIVIGTQMIAKGHHFPKLALVGIVDADLGLEGGDLRAMERTYQMLHQVAGRAGREEDLGKVVMQTYHPKSPVIEAVAKESRDEFVENEIMTRKRFHMPPFGRLATIVVSGKNEQAVKRYITDLSLKAPRTHEIQLLGPAPAPMSFLRGQHRYRLIVKSDKKLQIQKYIAAVLKTSAAPSSLRVKVDIDPFNFV